MAKDFTVDPVYAAPGDDITISGTGFNATDAYTITFVLDSGGVSIGGGTTDGSGAFTETVTVPTAATRGAHNIVVVDDLPGHTESFTVKTDWPCFGRDLAGSCCVPYDNILTVANVAAVLNDHPRWKYLTGGRVTARPVIVDGVVYVGSEDHVFYAIDALSGDLIWSYATGGQIHSTAHVIDGFAYFGSDDGYIYCLDVSDGSLAWRVLTGGPVTGSGLVFDGVFFIGGTDGTVYALDITDGSEVWTTVIQGGELECAQPVSIFEGNLYVPLQLPEDVEPEHVEIPVGILDLTDGTVAAVAFYARNSITTHIAIATDTRGQTHGIFGSADHYRYDINVKDILNDDGDVVVAVGDVIWANLESGDALGGSAISVVDDRATTGEHDWRVSAKALGTGESTFVRDGQNSSAIEVTSAITGKVFASAWPVSNRDNLSKGGDGRVGVWETFEEIESSGQVPIWKYPEDPRDSGGTGQFGYGHPAFGDSRLYVGSDDFNLYCFG